MYLFELSVEEERRIDIKNAFIDGNVIGRKEGKIDSLFNLIKKRLLVKKVALRELGLSFKEFEKYFN